MRTMFSSGVMPDKPFWLNVYEGIAEEPRPFGVICTTREVAEHCAKKIEIWGLGSVLYRLHVKPKVRTVDLADVYGYGPSAPGWREPT
jgi:hypothetical protein